MKILVTGLSMQGNKGAPALALSLAAQLSARISDLKITFAVAPGPHFQNELCWAKRFGFDVTERFVYGEVLRLEFLKHIPGASRSWRRWMRRVREAALMVDLSAISYVGPPLSGRRNVYRNSRFSYFLSARKARKPFLAWTQSYGPFSTRLLRLMARWDLGSQPMIFCRGKRSLEEVRKLLPEKKAESFPDVATMLPFHPEEGRRILRRIWPGDEDRKMVTVTPSAVLYQLGEGGVGGNSHLRRMSSLCRRLLDSGYRVLLVPHTHRLGDPPPARCDAAVCRLILSSLEGNENLRMVDGDHSPSLLKAVISTSHVHLGGRYHSLVAALSSGVPAIALAWHYKYRDLMQQYGLPGYVSEEADTEASGLREMFGRLSAEKVEAHEGLKQRQRIIEAKVGENADLFVGLIGRAVS